MAHDVDYYNKVITKNNKKITKCNDVSSLSSGLAPLSSSPLGLPTCLALSPAEPPLGGIDTPAPILDSDLIKPDNVKRAIVQLWHNPGQRREWKLKARLNLDFGEGEEAVDFIAPLNKDWGNYTKYHPTASKVEMVAWARSQRSDLKSHGINPYLGKFHNNQGWRQEGKVFNQNEPYSAAIVWYNKDTNSWYASVRIYAWEEIFQLSKEGLNDRQANCRGQKIWMNPKYYQIQRPKTWAEQRFGK